MNRPDVYLNPQFLQNYQEFFELLRQTVHWDDRMRARKTASFGVSYNYSQITYVSVPMPAALQEVCVLLHKAINFLPNNCLLNYYENGDSSMGFHSDSTEELEAGTGVAIVSLGDVRSIVFRMKRDQSVEHSYPLPGGSLLYMAREIQDDWLHAIPKMTHAGERISLTFRSILK